MMISLLEHYVEVTPLGTSHIHGLQLKTPLDDAYDVVVIGSGAA